MLSILCLLLLIATMLLILFKELPQYQFRLAHIPVTLCLGACVYVLLLWAGVGEPGTLSETDANRTPWIVFGGALSGLAVLVSRLITTGRALVADDGIGSPIPRIGFSLGLWILSSAAAVYLVWTAVDH